MRGLHNGKLATADATCAIISNEDVLFEAGVTRICLSGEGEAFSFFFLLNVKVTAYILGIII